MLASTEPAPTPPPLPMGASGVARFAGADPSGARNYYRARYYDPKLGRFISEDPIGFNAGINFYVYVGNSPPGRTDPTGLQGIVTTTVCALSTFKRWHMLGDAVGWRFSHCMAACELRKDCDFTERQTYWFGVMNEMGQTATCLAIGKNCGSANAPKDYEDNEEGYTCPDDVPCWLRCAEMYGKDKGPGDDRPFDRGPDWTPNYWSRWRR